MSWSTLTYEFTSSRTFNKEIYCPELKATNHLLTNCVLTNQQNFENPRTLAQTNKYDFRVMLWMMLTWMMSWIMLITKGVVDDVNMDNVNRQSDGYQTLTIFSTTGKRISGSTLISLIIIDSYNK